MGHKKTAGVTGGFSKIPVCVLFGVRSGLSAAGGAGEVPKVAKKESKAARHRGGI
jgi:hypothetical protein